MVITGKVMHVGTCFYARSLTIATRGKHENDPSEITVMGFCKERHRELECLINKQVTITIEANNISALPPQRDYETTQLIADMVQEWGNRGETTSIYEWDKRCKAVILRMKQWLGIEEANDTRDEL